MRATYLLIYRYVNDSLRFQFKTVYRWVRLDLGLTGLLEQTQNNCFWKPCNPGALLCSVGETLRTQGSPQANWAIGASDSCGVQDTIPLLLSDTTYLSVRPLMLFVLSLFLVALSSDASLRQTRGARSAEICAPVVHHTP